MSTPRRIPALSIALNDCDEYVLMATTHGRTAECGERIFRSEPWPAVKFRHLTREAAQAALATLQRYLEDWAAGKLRETEQRKRAWWED